MNARVDQVGQDEVHNAVLTAERHGGFGAFLRERVQTRSFAAGEHERQDSKLHDPDLLPEGAF